MAKIPSPCGAFANAIGATRRDANRNSNRVSHRRGGAPQTRSVAGRRNDGAGRGSAGTLGPAYAAALDDLPRVWLDRSAAAHDEIVADVADAAQVVTTLVTAVNLGRARLIRDALHTAQRREAESPRQPLPDLDDFALHFQGVEHRRRFAGSV
jgi:hypothetical protein